MIQLARRATLLRAARCPHVVSPVLRSLPSCPSLPSLLLLLALPLAACVTPRPAPEQPPTVSAPTFPPRRPPSSPIPEPAKRADPPGRSAAPPAAPPSAEIAIPRDDPPRDRIEGADDVRIGLATAAQSAVLAATGPWRLYDARNSVLSRASASDSWNVERRGRQLRATRSTGGSSTGWVDSPIILRPDRDDGFGVFAGRRYRGAIRVVATETAMMIVNVLPIETYLRGVVPLEIGGRLPNEQAAVEAQAIAARSYTYVHLAAAPGSTSRNTHYDMLAGVSDQVYGGVDAEKPFSDEAVLATAGLVIKYGGRIVDAPYHSSCGGETASPEEVWRSSPEPYLKRVSDRIPGTTDRYYCDVAPRFAWTRAISGDELDAGVQAYLRNYVAVPAGGPGSVNAISVESRTPTGRVQRLLIGTAKGNYTLRGNEVRYVIRAPGSETLNSTYFTVEPEKRRGGGLTKVVIRGNGYGHGIGMCQWGAIGRARVGQTARTILATYYPGTTVGQAR